MEINTYISVLIENAIAEDIGDGDHSSLSCIPDQARGKAKLLVKQEGVLSGVEIAKMVFRKIDDGFTISEYIKDGSTIKVGDVVFEVEGKVRSLLQAERIVLNIMQRMSGIATQTKIYVDKLAGLKTKILDTRKTTPGMRFLDKMAVKHGGGENHRMGLFDMIMLKDNHIDFAGGIVEAVKAAQRYVAEKKPGLKIEVEVRTFNDIDKLLKLGGIDRIMLDNFSVEETRKAVAHINGVFEIESSGGITLDTIRDYAKCGVDYISVGALTHQIKSLDLSLKAIDY